ncbi:hypothetical protein D3C72_2231190 [compost metagenome]
MLGARSVLVDDFAPSVYGSNLPDLAPSVYGSALPTLAPCVYGSTGFCWAWASGIATTAAAAIRLEIRVLLIVGLAGWGAIQVPASTAPSTAS